MNDIYKIRQQGVAMVIALVALAALSLAGVALMRTVDTGNVVSGNLAFNEAAIQLADIGAEQAYWFINGNLQDIPNNCADPVGNLNNQLGSCPSYYYPNISNVDAATKLPAPAGGLTWSDAQEVLLPGETTGNGTYTVQYVIERMCTGTANAQEVPTFARCTAAPIYDTTGTIPITGQGKLFYRVTVQVSGPRNTRSLSQYFYGIQDVVN